MPKNVLWISIDDLKDWSAIDTLYQGGVPTPHLDALMARGTQFTEAFVQTPICQPSRTSALTGTYPSTNHDLDINELAWYKTLNVSETLPHFLKSQGYTTATAGKIFHWIDYPTAVTKAMWDQAVGSAGGVSNPELLTLYGGADIPYTGTKPLADQAIVTWAANYLNNTTASQPFFLALGLTKPHDPWNAPQAYFNKFALDKIILPEVPANDMNDVPKYAYDFMGMGAFDVPRTELEAKKLVQAYLACVSFLDDQIGRLMQAVDASGHADDTTIVFWSDHGYQHGEKHNWNKFTLWDVAARAPLAIIDPDIGNPGSVSHRTVEMVDLFPTIVDLAGLQRPGWLEGSSLRPLLQNPNAAWDNPAITSIYGSYSLRTEQYRYIRYEDGSEELYNIKADPREYTNLAGSPSLAGVKASLAARLDTFLAEQGVVHGTAGNDVLHGTAGTNQFYPGTGTDEMRGGKGNDLYQVNSPDDRIIELAGEGEDTVLVWVTNYTMPDHVENLKARGWRLFKPMTLIGNDLPNKMAGDNLDDVIEGRGGNDDIEGGEGHDRIFAGSGVDQVAGGSGNDQQWGGIGADTLWGFAGSDTLWGEADNDRLEGYGENDELRGGAGSDLLLGMAGHDKLFGDEGTDSLFGGDGNDLLDGGGGNDILAGDTGADIYAFTPGGGQDRINGFLNGTDKLRFQGFGASFDTPAEIIAKAVQIGSDTTITLPNPAGGGTTSVILTGFARSNLDVSDFALLPIPKAYAINAGGPAFTAADGTIYTADQGYTGGGWITRPSNLAIANTVDDALFRAERYLIDPFGYRLQIQNGTYDVTLRFAETFFTAAGKRSFDVLLEGATAIDNLDVFAATGGANRAHDVVRRVAVTDGWLDIGFKTEVGAAMVNAIKVAPVSTSAGSIPIAAAGNGFSPAPLADTENGGPLDDRAANAAAYDMPINEVPYGVTQQFSEEYLAAATQRRFDVTVEEQLDIDSLDISTGADSGYAAIAAHADLKVDAGRPGIDRVAELSTAALSAFHIDLIDIA